MPARLDLCDAAAGSDRLVVDLHSLVCPLVLRRPAAHGRIDECAARAGNLGGLGGVAGGEGKKCCSGGENRLRAGCHV